MSKDSCMQKQMKQLLSNPADFVILQPDLAQHCPHVAETVCYNGHCTHSLDRMEIIIG